MKYRWKLRACHVENKSNPRDYHVSSFIVFSSVPTKRRLFMPVLLIDENVLRVSVYAIRCHSLQDVKKHSGSLFKWFLHQIYFLRFRTMSPVVYLSLEAHLLFVQKASITYFIVNCQSAVRLALLELAQSIWMSINQPHFCC